MKRFLLVLLGLVCLCSCTPSPARGFPEAPKTAPAPLTEEAPVSADTGLEERVDPLPDPLGKALYVNGRAVKAAYRKDGALFANAGELSAILQAQLQSNTREGSRQSVQLTLPDGTLLFFSTDAQGPERCLYTYEASFLIPCDVLLQIGYRCLETQDRVLFTFVPDPASLPENVKVPTLMYHAVSDDCWGIRQLFVSPEKMEQQIVWLLNEGYTPIFFEDLPYAHQIQKPILLTFDDGYDDNYLHLYPLVLKYKVKVNIFLITESVGGGRFLTREQITQMNQSGLVSFQSHTATHPYLDELSEDQLREEFSRSKKMLCELLNKEPFVLCYPSGRYSSLSLKIAREYYSFGLLMSGGRSYSTSDDPLCIRRDYVARSTTLSDLEKMLAS